MDNHSTQGAPTLAQPPVLSPTFLSVRRLTGLLGAFLFVVGLLLLGLMMGGVLTGSLSPAPGALTELRDYRQRIAAGGRFDLEEATTRVLAGTFHTPGRQIGLWENWLQWSLAAIHPPLARTQETDILLRDGQGDCSQRGQVLKSIAESAGRRCRFVGLGGHVLLEVADETAGDWRAVDADYGIVYPVATLGLEGERVTLALERRGYTPEVIERYRQILESAHDNVVLAEGSALSPRLALVEELCRWLAWGIPLGMMACAVFVPRLRA